MSKEEEERTSEDDTTSQTLDYLERSDANEASSDGSECSSNESTDSDEREEMHRRSKADEQKKNKNKKKRKKKAKKNRAEHVESLPSIYPLHRWQRKGQLSTKEGEKGEGTVRLRHRSFAEGGVLDGIVMGEPTAVTDTEATQLFGYIEESSKNSERFYSAADKNRKRHNWTQLIVLVILGVTAGGSTLYNLLTPTDDGTFAYRVTLNVLLVISTILQAMQRTFKFEQKGTNYEMTGDDYHNYVRLWLMRVAQGIDDRRDKCTAALTDARTSLREIELGALPL